MLCLWSSLKIQKQGNKSGDIGDRLWDGGSAEGENSDGEGGHRGRLVPGLTIETARQERAFESSGRVGF